MAFINITSIEILNNPSDLSSTLNFKITFECLRDIPEEIEWKVIYVGSSKDQHYDQTLDCFCLGPLEYGVMQFDLETNPPDITKIPKAELLGVPAIIISVSYHQQEFFRVGYFLYNNYVDQELIDNPPEEVILKKAQKYIRR